MRAVADVAAGVVHASVDIKAPVERVYRALTDGKQLAQWWGQPDMYKTFDWVLDLRPGGQWSAQVLGADGARQEVRGQFLVVEPPHLIVMTWSPSWEGYTTTTIRYELSATASGTRVKVVHSGFATPEACEGHANGWNRVLGWLESKIEIIS